jgi:hypothetical protein
LSSHPNEGGRSDSYPSVVIARLRPYALHLYLLAYAAAMLVVDGSIRELGPQLALGVVTFGVLWLCTRSLEPGERWQVWVCVAVATVFEVFASLVWGVYRYRMHNIPLYVPPGHGMVYLFGLTAGQLPVFRRYGRRAAYVVLAACTAYVIAGLTVLPPLTHRVDVQGALCLPVLAYCILFSRRYALFAAIFVATLDIELAGTWSGDWIWMAVAPWAHAPSGNPPAAIAGGYCIIDGTVLLVLTGLQRVARRLRPAEPLLGLELAVDADEGGG